MGAGFGQCLTRRGITNMTSSINDELNDCYAVYCFDSFYTQHAPDVDPSSSSSPSTSSSSSSSTTEPGFKGAIKWTLTRLLTPDRCLSRRHDLGIHLGSWKSPTLVVGEGKGATRWFLQCRRGGTATGGGGGRAGGSAPTRTIGSVTRTLRPEDRFLGVHLCCKSLLEEEVAAAEEENSNKDADVKTTRKNHRSADDESEIWARFRLSLLDKNGRRRWTRSRTNFVPFSRSNPRFGFDDYFDVAELDEGEEGEVVEEEEEEMDATGASVVVVTSDGASRPFGAADAAARDAAYYKYEENAVVRANFDALFPGGDATLLCEMELAPAALIRVPASRRLVMAPAHRASAIDTLARMRVDADLFADATLVSALDGGKVRCHKAVLAVASPVFKAMFLHDDGGGGGGGRGGGGRGGGGDEFVLGDNLDGAVIRAMIDFIYEGHVADTNANGGDGDDGEMRDEDSNERLEELAFELFRAAEKYHLPGLSQLCRKTIAEKCLTPDNVADVFAVASMHSAPDLAEAAAKFARRHPAEVTGSDAWKRLKRERPEIEAKIWKEEAEEEAHA